MTITHSDECFRCGKANHNSPERSHVFQLDQRVCVRLHRWVARAPRKSKVKSSPPSTARKFIIIITQSNLRWPGVPLSLGTSDRGSDFHQRDWSVFYAVKKVLVNAALISRKTASNSPHRVQQGIWHFLPISSVVF